MLSRATESTSGQRAGERTSSFENGNLTGWSRIGVAVSITPGVLAVGLFYSLALHMHHSLQGWPAGIGEAGFPAGLRAHALVATNFFWITLMISFFTLPVAILVSGLVARWRHLVPYFVLYALVFVAGIALMQIAPEPFLDWWRD